jgi:hypothetical protein
MQKHVEHIWKMCFSNWSTSLQSCYMEVILYIIVLITYSNITDFDCIFIEKYEMFLTFVFDVQAYSHRVCDEPCTSPQ